MVAPLKVVVDDGDVGDGGICAGWMDSVGACILAAARGARTFGELGLSEG